MDKLAVNITNDYGSNLMSRVTSREVLDTALEHIRKVRISDAHNSDIWHLKFHWKRYRNEIRTKLLAGKYQLSPVTVFKGQDGQYYSRWSAADSVVLKALSLVLKHVIGDAMTKRCTHLKGNGGVAGALKVIDNKILDYEFVLKSDVADFYADKRIIAILSQYMNRLEIVCGEYKLIDRGISKGCPLSPLMGAIILKSLDTVISRKFPYVRYMDDWVILTKTRKELRQVVKQMHTVMQRLKFKLAYDKTYIGRTKNGFNFLGKRFGPAGIIGLADITLEEFFDKKRFRL
jgi:RNA-directed DNA polymerase